MLDARRIEWRYLLAPAVLAGALGYVVDIFDLNLDANYRQQLFTYFGVPADQTVNVVTINSWYSRGGLLLGGFLWGILGDRRGRVLSLFGSIAVYSIGVLGIAAFCHSLIFFRFATFAVGVGLAGELGGSVTLVLESLPATMRTFGVMLIAALGMTGVVLAGSLVEVVSWRPGYVIGGLMGLALLAFRMHVRESLLFQRVHDTKVSRGNWFELLWPWPELRRYLACILVGVAPLYVLAFYTAFAPELAQQLHVIGDFKVNRASIAVFSGLSVGDLLVAWLSYRIASRKRPILWFMASSAVLQTLIYFAVSMPLMVLYILYFMLGMATANALYVTTTAEQFGTNLRDTATTTVTNFIRFGVAPLLSLVSILKPSVGLLQIGFITGLVVLFAGIVALASLRETYGSDIDFVEKRGG
jgi:MFS family permease